MLISGDGVARSDTCTFDGNFIVGPSGGGGFQVLDGAFVHVVGSTFVGNSSLGTGSGGAVFVNRGELLLERSTVSGNSSAREGGGIHAGATLPTSTATVTVIDSTIVGNTADSDGDGIGDGGGLSVTIAIGPVTLALHNSIIAGNTTGTGAAASADMALHPSVVIGGGKFTLIGINDSAASHYPAGDPNAAGNFVGTSAAPIDALLQPLANYGGPTLTHRPLNDPATRVIDHGKCSGEIADQRGFGNAALGLRIVDAPSIPNHAASDGCDIGAVERGAAELLPAWIFADGFDAGHTLRWTSEVL